jgi:5-methylcytosine-specific restriction endonuclease McrA
MEYEEIDRIIEKCSRCENEVINPAKSKRKIVCKNCLCIEKTGKTLFETLREKQKAQQARSKERQKLKPIPQYQPKKKINFFSDKGKTKHDEISEKKRIVRQQAERLDETYCKGCYRADCGLDTSHIISIAQRPDLATDINNISLLCRNCHVKHESGNIKLMLELNCFEKDMRYIYAHDETKFNKVLFKLLDYVETHPQDKKAVSIISKLENYEQA